MRKTLLSSYYKKNVRSLNSRERVDQLTQGVEGCKSDAVLIS